MFIFWLPLFFFKSAKQGTSIYLTASYFNGNSAPGYGGARFGSDDILNSGSSQPVYISSDCAAGTFNDGDGSIIDCNECPDTSMPANLLNTACKVCEPGNWSQDGALTCYPVPKPTAVPTATPAPTPITEVWFQKVMGMQSGTCLRADSGGTAAYRDTCGDSTLWRIVRGNVTDGSQFYSLMTNGEIIYENIALVQLDSGDPAYVAIADTYDDSISSSCLIFGSNGNSYYASFYSWGQSSLCGIADPIGCSLGSWSGRVCEYDLVNGGPNNQGLFEVYVNGVSASASQVAELYPRFPIDPSPVPTVSSEEPTGSPSLEPNASWTNDSTKNKPTPVPTPQHCIAGTHSELSSCISSSSAGDVIRLANDIAMTGQISISGKSAFTIKSSPGKRYTLRGSGSDRLFFISSSTVKFQDLRMENGKVNLSMKPPFFELFPPCSPLLSL